MTGQEELKQGPGLIRHPLRLPSQVDGIGLAFNMQQQPTIRFDGVSVYRQQPSSRDRALIESYDRVPVDDRHVEALASWQGNSGS